MQLLTYLSQYFPKRDEDSLEYIMSQVKEPEIAFLIFKMKVEMQHVEQKEKLFSDGSAGDACLSKSPISQWKDICDKEDLTESFLRFWAHEFDAEAWDSISKKQKLSESFVEDFKHKVNWCAIAKYQFVSVDFLDKHNQKINPREAPLEGSKRT